MTRILRAAPALLMLLVAAPAMAQFDQDTRYQPEIRVDDGTRTRPQGTYVVVKGDTLWGLSEEVFNDGAFWPTLWSYNPQVTNPHWIYPGDLVYLRPRVKPHTESKVTYAKSRFSDKPRLEQILGRFKGFVSERNYRESGTIHSSREEKVMLGEYDEAYLKFSIPKRILPGEEYTIYRTDKPIHDPTTGKRLGFLIRHLGIARVLNVDRTKPYIKSLILDSYQEIQRGDLLTKRVWRNELVVPVENRVATWAQIAETFKDVNQFGEHDYVIVNRGFKQKIRRGNRFIIRWRGDGYVPTAGSETQKHPWENHGEVMIIEPFENTSLGIVLRSVREVPKGAHLEMIRGY